MPRDRSFAAEDAKFASRIKRAGIELNTVFDIGASSGVWSDYVSATLPGARFDLFEPFAHSPQYETRFRDITRTHPGFNWHFIALGERNETLRLNILETHSGNSLIDSDWEGVKEKRNVDVRRLDDYVEENDLPAPDLIKMDIQGFELNALKGGESTCKKAKVIMLETWLYRGYGPETPVLSEIIDWLDKRDFRIVATGDTYVAPDMRLTSIDAYFLRSDIADALVHKGINLKA